MHCKPFLRTVLATATVALTCAAAMLPAHAGGRALASSVTLSTSASTTTLSTAEIAGLDYMREEEKLAHDVYTALYTLWGTAVFDNIAASEASHTAAVLNLLVTYGLEDPAAGLPAGSFRDANLQALYTQLMDAGSLTEIEGLKVGALIEETDIRDIRAKMAETDEATILSVYDHLMCGSRNHLRAFDGQLDARGVVYFPTVISQAEWDAISTSPMERCR
jgi:hypothetical protein